MLLLWVLLALGVALLGYIRIAPSDIAYWHNPQLPEMAPGEYPGPDRFVGQYVQADDGRAAFARLHDVALATPRTSVLAGSPADGKITYITRSRLMGYPDYTTVKLTQLPATENSTLQIFARQRFGQMDLGVNEARVKAWIAQSNAPQPAGGIGE